MESLQKKSLVAILGRWQPVHLGHQAALTALCQRFQRVVIGIGSSNIHNYRNPFSITEVTQMLQLSLKRFDNYTLVPIPDFLDDQEWCQRVVSEFGQPEHFISANPFVSHLLEKKYPISHPSDFVDEEKKVAINATMVRQRIAQGDGWFQMVPVEIKAFMLENKLDERFRTQFGLQTLAMEVIII